MFHTPKEDHRSLTRFGKNAIFYEEIRDCSVFDRAEVILSSVIPKVTIRPKLDENKE